jgi:peptidoglycan/xylan/chitin deacetylase (PgdA/CDA1 family)/ketosteroid isomerase-like protein
MLRLASTLLLVVAALPAPSPAAPRPLLVTVDDLPIAGRAARTPAERRALTRAHLAALRAHGIRAVGFVTWRNVHAPEDVELLKLWLDAGHELGNHSDRHLSLTATALETYLADVERARARLQELLAARGLKLRFFRFPFLREGDTPEKVEGLRRWLAETGQRSLPVTIDNQDWSFDEPWREASGARRAEIAADYQAALRLATRHHERRGDELLGRALPQVLLLHANAVGASEWPRLFEWLKREGYRFATADDVLADPVFAETPAEPAPYGYGLWDRLRRQRDEAQAREQVAELLRRQAEAWTAGDLEAFCAVYADDALFISPGSGQTRGRQAVLERYRRRYPDPAAMGALTLESIEARPLSGVEVTPLGDAVPGRVHALSVVARWTLRHADREPATGLTLLVLRREPSGWRIVQDASF